MYEMEIFYDTLEHRMEHSGFYLGQQLKEHGFYCLTALGRKDSFEYPDHVTYKMKWLVWDSTLMKQGKWVYYHDNGNIESEGLYRDNKKKGDWKYYNEKGELLKKEDL